MLLCRVERRIWGTRRADGLEGITLLEVRPVRFGGGDGAPLLRYDKERGLEPAAGQLGDAAIVAADRLGAGVGELVLVGTGSRVRDLVFGDAAPLKTVVLAIVDRAEEAPC
jgi:ethanolamine utilization protein EutN